MKIQILQTSANTYLIDAQTGNKHEDSPILNLGGKCVNFHEAVPKSIFYVNFNFEEHFFLTFFDYSNFLISFFSKNGHKLCRFGEISKKYFKGIISVGLKYVLNIGAA